jgi:murein L,D-transpeptidase YcbB/YkuD
MPHASHRFRSARRRPAALVLATALGAASALAACGDGSRRTAAAADTAGGEVDRGWNPATLSEVAGVPVAAVRQALATRLEGERPAPLTEVQWKHVRALYRRFQGNVLWMDEKGPDKSRATALLKALVSGDRDALRLDAYPLPALAQALVPLRDGQRATPEQLAEADVLLTSAYAALGEDLLTGQVNPRTVSQDWHIDPRDEEVDSALVRSLREAEIDRGIARMRPQNPDYEVLRTALVQYRDLAKRGGWAAIPAGRALKPGEPDAAARIQALRARLAAEGLLGTDSSAAAARQADSSAVPAPNAIGGNDSAARKRPARVRAPRAGELVYDVTLAGAVAAYQARHAITVDSMLGAETVKSMNLPTSYRLGQIAANLERHRWMPRELGERYVFVNVPAFHLEAYEGGKKALDMRVIVGEEYEGRRTAVFSDTMTTVVFRPYWFVTDDIANEELWPKQNADPGYFAANNYETWNDAGTTRIRQTPGPKNSLGLVKFLFPNAFNIYLHDTPNDNLFAKDVRAFSHGCIRLEKPAEFAQWVLGWSADSVQRAMTTEPDNKEIKVARRLPVYISYFTTYVQDGQLRFGNDLYDRDTDMVKAVTAEAGQRPEMVEAVQAIRRLVGEGD